MWRLRTRDGIRDDRGAAAVEFALVSVLLALLLFGMVQFGLVLNQWLQLEHATREGARWASLRNSAAYVKTMMIDSAPGLPLTAGDITISPADPSAAPPQTQITVHAVAEVPVFTPLMESFLGTEVQLSSTTTMRVE